MSPALQARGYRLVTARIIYYLPDHPHLLQIYVWQEFDLPPKFPILTQFLDFWDRKIEGKRESVKVWSAEGVQPPVFGYATHLTLH